MERNTIGKILNFLKEKEGKEYPMNWNLIERLETHPDDIQYKHDSSLPLSYTRITKLPNDLYVGGSLFLKDTNITKLPDKLYVGRNLFIGNTPLERKYTDEQIYEMITLRGGELVGNIFR